METQGTLDSGLVALGVEPLRVEELAGDASRRRFFRVYLAGGTTIVAAVYPDGQEHQAARDLAVQVWGWGRRLPIPRPLGRHGLVTASSDLGDDDLERILPTAGDGVLGSVLESLAAFQACGFADLPTAPFDAAFFRSELAVFGEFGLRDGEREDREVGVFLDRLAGSLADHPYRLVHRDFHVNNLFLHGGRVWAVDFQDMRGGPDTYDLASLLRERGGVALVERENAVLGQAAARFGWTPGWERRYTECAAQRGLKVIGTFLRLAAGGRSEYLRWLPDVRERATSALAALRAPAKLCLAAAGRQGL